MQRWDLEYRGNPYSEHREMVPSDEYGEWVTFDDADAEIRRLRAMVLRAHAKHGPRIGDIGIAWVEWKYRQLPSMFDDHSCVRRAARLLNHFASAIEAGRL